MFIDVVSCIRGEMNSLAFGEQHSLLRIHCTAAGAVAALPLPWA